MVNRESGRSMRVAGLILAGGDGRRMGAEKPLTPFGNRTLIEAVIARAAPQVERLALNIALARKEAYVRFAAYPLIGDEEGAPKGPLAGLLAGLGWLSRLTDSPAFLASFPCDTPFLPQDLVAALTRIATPERPAVMRAGGEVQSLCALWPLYALMPLRRLVAERRITSVRDALFALEARILSRDDAEVFFNVNTPQDLAAAEAMTRRADLPSARSTPPKK